MEPLDAAALPAGALLLVDTAPTIYTLEANPHFAPHFAPLFERHAQGGVVLAVTAVTIAEVLTGPLSTGEKALTRRWKPGKSWVTTGITASAARMRATYRLKLPDAIQLASALAINAEALGTHDRDFARVRD